MIKAVIFDVGGVIVRTHDHSGRRYWEERLGLDMGGSDEVVFNSPTGQAAQRGEISDAALWAWVGEYLELGPDLDRFRRDFWAGDDVDAGLMGLIRSLRPRYQTAIISNATDALLDTLNGRHPIADAFDLIVGSAYERVMKPSPEIYLRTLERLGRRPEETVFVDDAPANVNAAAALGMNAVRFTPGLDLGREFARLGVVAPDAV